MIEERYKGYIIRAAGEPNECWYKIYTDKFKGIEGKWKLLRAMVNYPDAESALANARRYIDGFSYYLLKKSKLPTK